jgi:hypothetical protein
MELDWSRGRRTLSVSFPGHEGAVVPVGQAGPVGLPSLLAAHRAILEAPRQFGPVPAGRWTVQNQKIGQALEMELCLLPTGVPVLEVSFEEEDRDRARKSRTALRRELEDAGWALFSGDVLKTEMLFAAFA